jgi:hypothetical protein
MQSTEATSGLVILPYCSLGKAIPARIHSTQWKEFHETLSDALRDFFAVSAVALCGFGACGQNQPALERITSQAELDKAIVALDAALFDAYNRCDLEKFGSLITDR